MERPGKRGRFFLPFLLADEQPLRHLPRLDCLRAGSGRDEDWKRATGEELELSPGRLMMRSASRLKLSQSNGGVSAEQMRQK